MHGGMHGRHMKPWMDECTLACMEDTSMDGWKMHACLMEDACKDGSIED